jgi:hypothetical protein
MSRSTGGAIASALAHLALAVVAAHLLYLVGRPVDTNDLWWHLALGERYLAAGPWLDEDPLLFTATEAPANASWLFDMALVGVQRALGFHGLRVLHVGLVAAILALAYSCFRRATDSRLVACAATALLIVIASYRLAQLRPGLISILCALLLYRLLIQGDAAASSRRMAGAALICLVWANVHAVFLVGILLVAAAAVGMAAEWRLCRLAGGPVIEEMIRRSRMIRVSAFIPLALGVTLLNPRGWGQHGSFGVSAGQVRMWAVADDWSHFDPFSMPGWETQMSPLTWLAMDLVLAAFLATALVAAARLLWRFDARTVREADLPHLALGAAGCVALLVAIRFQWLAVFPMLAAARAGRLALRSRPGGEAIAGSALLALCVGLPVALVLRSDLRPVDLAPPTEVRAYLSSAVATHPYPTQAVAFLRSSGLEGNLFCVYPLGGYTGYWLAPKLRGFVNGTLNFPASQRPDYHAILEQRGAREGEGLLDVLDRHQIDVFLGVGLPVAGRPLRHYTTSHLEDAPGWIPIFRSLRSAVYLRANARNQENRRRVAEWFAGQRVAFDPARGFRAADALRLRPDWAIERGLVPPDYTRIRAATRARDRALKLRALDRTAGLSLALGLYADALQLDAELLRAEPEATAARQRRIFALLHLGRSGEARQEVEALTANPPDAQSAAFLNAARRAVSRHEDAPDAGSRASLAAIANELPVFTPEQAGALLADLVAAPLAGHPTRPNP